MRPFDRKRPFAEIAHSRSLLAHKEHSLVGPVICVLIFLGKNLVNIGKTMVYEKALYVCTQL